MHPVLFTIPLVDLPLYSYGFMLALSFLTGIWYAGKRAAKNGLSPEAVSDVGFWIILSAVIGARLYYVILHFEEFQGNLLSIINPFQGSSVGIGGLVLYGGVIGAIFAGYAFFKIKNLPFHGYADAIAPVFGTGIFFTRIGCYLHGCCWGRATDSALGVVFPTNCPAGHYQHINSIEHLFPAQLFLAFAGLLMAGIVLLVEKKKPFVGFQFYLTIAIYAIIRFLGDFTRHYRNNESIMGLSHNQIVCIVLFSIMMGIIFYGVKNKDKFTFTLPEKDNNEEKNNSKGKPSKA